jgi:hypothetical protein
VSILNQIKPPAAELAQICRASPARTDEKTNEMTGIERKQDNDPVTWVGLAWRIIDIASQSNGKLLRVCALLLVVALVGVAWWWAPHVW